MMKLLLLVICSTQVVWVEAAIVLVNCTTTLYIGHADPKIFVGFWTRETTDVSSRPVYKSKSLYTDAMYLKYIKEATGEATHGWYIGSTPDPTMTSTASDIYAFLSEDTLICPEDFTDTASWKYANTGNGKGPSAALTDATITTRASDCTLTANADKVECVSCAACTKRIKVENAASTVNGYYQPVVGVTSDERPVYKNTASTMYLISQGSFWRFTSVYTTYAYKASITEVATLNTVSCPEKISLTTTGTGTLRCSDCSDTTTTLAECATNCESCKKVMEGTNLGSYTLEASNSTRCINGCVYKKGTKSYCFNEKTGAAIVQQGCTVP